MGCNENRFNQFGITIRLDTPIQRHAPTVEDRPPPSSEDGDRASSQNTTHSAGVGIFLVERARAGRERAPFAGREATRGAADAAVVHLQVRWIVAVLRETAFIVRHERCRSGSAHWRAASLADRRAFLVFLWFAYAHSAAPRRPADGWQAAASRPDA